jgi:hypothetical protein
LATSNSIASIEGLIVAARLGVVDRRDLKLAADARRSHPYLPVRLWMLVLGSTSLCLVVATFTGSCGRV